MIVSVENQSQECYIWQKKDFNISLSDSFMGGDGENDIIAGNAAGCRSVLIANKQENTIDKGIAADVVNDVV